MHRPASAKACARGTENDARAAELLLGLLLRVIQAVALFVFFWATGYCLPQTAQQDHTARTLPQPGEQSAKRNHSFEELAEEANKHSFRDILNNDPAAVSNIEEIFAVTSQTELKERIASILMRIRVRDPVYFDYLSGEAKKALEINMPWAIVYDPETGRETGINPAFVKWCEKHHRNQQEAFEESRYQIPIPWFYLASAGDPRAYDLLVRGLHADNPMITQCAAFGLAKLQDPRAIKEIISVSRDTEKKGIRLLIAEALWYFPDETARKAADALARAWFHDYPESHPGHNDPLAEIRQAFTQKSPKDILSFEGLIPPNSLLIPPPRTDNLERP